MSETYRNKGGRPPVNATPITVRLPPVDLAELDGWIAEQPQEMTRPEAIRTLLRMALEPKAD